LAAHSENDIVKSPAPKISVIIVNWNGRNDTLECLESLSRVEYPNFDVIVVDNGSSDGSAQAIREDYPVAILVETGKNLGFAGANNVGMRLAMSNGSRYVFLLNNDTVADPQVLTRLAAAADRTPAGGIFGAKIYSYFDRNRIWYAGAKWNNKCSGFLHVGQGATDDGQAYGSFEETDYACGCAFFAGTDLLHKVGLLDEKYFLTFEETDLCCRARKQGFASYFVPDAVIWHKVSTAFGGENSPLFHYFLMRNRLLWAERNLPLKARLALYRKIAHHIALCLLPARPARSERGTFWSDYHRALIAKRDDPYRKASLCAARDYLLRRFGDCSDKVRAVCRKSAPATCR
jgi:GT2 family glycosyltransferase